jgi:hypothetical protein
MTDCGRLVYAYRMVGFASFIAAATTAASFFADLISALLALRFAHGILLDI